LKEKAISRYLEVVKGSEEPRINELGKELQEKIDKAKESLKECSLCERKCRVNRIQGEEGYCGVKNKPVLSTAFRHSGEERFLVPSYTIFFMGCNFHCQYCQNFRISQWKASGRKLSIEELADTIEKSNSCKNVNFVGGDPTPNLPFILEALRKKELEVPVVWNSNFYMSERSMDLLSSTVDIYLSDWKYGNSECGERLSKAPDYWEIIKRNHDLAHHDSELVIRHLVLPNHFECCTKPILEYISQNYREDVIVNIMGQYRPSYRAKQHSDINRPLKRREARRAWNLAEELNLNYTK